MDALVPTEGKQRASLPTAGRYVLTLTEMLIDGAVHLEDIIDFEEDEAYKEMTGRSHYPTSDALGDWLRRQGGTVGEKKIMNVASELTNALTKGTGLTLDVDATVIEADKETHSTHTKRCVVTSHYLQHVLR